MRSGQNESLTQGNTDQRRAGGAIAVIDWNRGGHHETYLAAYVRGLRATKREVVVLCRDPSGLRAAVQCTAGAQLRLGQGMRG